MGNQYCKVLSSLRESSEKLHNNSLQLKEDFENKLEESNKKHLETIKALKVQIKEAYDQDKDKKELLIRKEKEIEEESFENRKIVTEMEALDLKCRKKKLM